MKTTAAGEQTSEEIFGIVKQPPPTCPLVDEAIKIVQACADDLRGYERMDEEDLRRAISDIEDKLSELAPLRSQWRNSGGLLEDIRTNAGAIREWGQDWKDLAKKLQPQPSA